jgi:uncharacterized membrane protein YphA (DoxX/SURF4 family)
MHLPSKGQMVSGFVLVTRLVLGCMFIMSSLPKIQLPLKFLSDVYGYELVGPRLGVLVAMTLSWLELLVGVCLVGGIFVAGALLTSATMGAMFAVVLASALIRGLDISCGCFGVNTGKINYLTLLRAVVILLVSGLAYAGIVLRDKTEPST